VANWEVRAPSVPADNWGGRGWSIWQFTNSGRVAGISGRVDRNRLRVRFSRISVRR
jgi:GH25 family lysozyme M1 (1,4-beta-N-acetylmuramidase)